MYGKPMIAYNTGFTNTIRVLYIMVDFISISYD